MLCGVYVIAALAFFSPWTRNNTRSSTAFQMISRKSLSKARKLHLVVVTLSLPFSLPVDVFWEESFRNGKEKIGGFAFVVRIEPVHVDHDNRVLFR